MKAILKTVLLSIAFSAIVHADAKETAKSEIARQYNMIKRGEVAALKERFTQRLRDRVTEDRVKRAQREIQNYPLSSLVDSVIEGDYQGKKTIKIKMKNGRTLTTLVREGNEWYADTLWFK